MGQTAGRDRSGADERRLLGSAATRIYTDAVTRGSLPADDALRVGTEWSAVEQLLDMGLLRLDEATARLHPVDPVTVQAQVVVPLGLQGAELIAESARWAETFNHLGQVFRTSPQFASSSITEIHGLGNINSFIHGLVNDAREELLTAQPDGRRPADTLAVAKDRDVKALARGVRMRTLYQHSARQSPVTREYVADVVSHGAEVRTLDEFFRRLIVVDQQVAVVPASDNNRVAIAIHDTSVISYLVDVFERSWERGLRFDQSGPQAERNIAADVHAMTIRLLLEGHSDPASAKRLGVSTRTYAGYIAALKEEYGVQTRFQLGYAMGAEPRHIALGPDSALPAGQRRSDDADPVGDQARA